MSKFEVYDRLFRNNTLKEIEDFGLFNLMHHKHYKPFNCALIMAQRPGATFVQTEKSWKKLGCEIKPEATPIVIMQVNGPVTLVYDMEDVYNIDQQMKFDEDYSSGPHDKQVIDIQQYNNWLNHVHKKGIRTAESRLGERMKGKAEPLDNPIQIVYTVIDKCQKTEKAIMAYHQITINSNLTSHEKALTLLHELGHLYCGHVSGLRTKGNSLPEYRYENIDRNLESINSELTCIRKRMQEIRDNKQYIDEYQKLSKRYDELEKSENKILNDLNDQQEYEAQLVCKLLCERNYYLDDFSNDYLEQHTLKGVLPDISLQSVMEAIEKISGILDI